MQFFFCLCSAKGEYHPPHPPTVALPALPALSRRALHKSLNALREVTTEVFLSASSVGAPQSALFVAWAQLLCFDIFLNVDNETQSFDIPCDDGNGFVDVWCPEGAASDDIPFFRSQV